MRRRRARHHLPSFFLESRRLLSETGICAQQDDQDHVAKSGSAYSDDFQDTDILIGNIPAGETITNADVTPVIDGANNGEYGPGNFAAYIQQNTSAQTVNIFVQPTDEMVIGDSYSVVLDYQN